MTSRGRAILLISLTAGVAIVVLLFSLGGDTARDVTKALDLRGDPPFAIRLSGPLWRDRTLRSEDGTPDVGYVTGDGRLDVLVAGAGHARVAEVELRVDGRLQRRLRPPCPGMVCPPRLDLVLRPRITGPVSADRSVEVIARDRKAAGGGPDVDPHVSVAKFEVHVDRRLPPVREGEPVTASLLPPTRGGTRTSRLRASALRVLSRSVAAASSIRCLDRHACR